MLISSLVIFALFTLACVISMLIWVAQVGVATTPTDPSAIDMGESRHSISPMSTQKSSARVFQDRVRLSLQPV